MMKRIYYVLCICILLISGCGTDEQNDSEIDIIATIFPVYDWTQNIVGEDEKVNVRLLLDNGVDMHSYQPTVEDIVAIKKCDLFIYVGGESEEWMEDILAEPDTHARVINLMDIMGDLTIEEEIREGMSLRDEESNDMDKDEHLWLSLRNAGICIGAIYDSICELNEENCEAYTANYENYCKDLEAADEYYSQLMETVDINTVVVADRFPFAYMINDYGLDYYAAFPGCYADASASFETLFFLAERVEENKLETIMSTESSDGTIPEAVEKIADGAQRIVKLDSMQAVSMKDIEDGADYLKIMMDNLQALYEACKRG